MSKKFYICLVFTFFLASLSSVPARAMTVTCTNCSTEVTSVLDRITSLDQLRQLATQVGEAIVQTEQQITMVMQNVERYENMIRNTLALPQEIRQRLEGQYQRLAALYSRVKTYSNDLAGIRNAYKEVYPAFGGTLREFEGNFETWSARVDETNQALTEVSELQLGELRSEEKSAEFDEQISDLIATPEGRMQAIQATNQLVAMQLQESRELRALMATYAQEQAAFNAKQEKLNQASEEHMREVFETKDPGDPSSVTRLP